MHLGTLPAGASGTFTVLYNWQERGANAPAAQSFFLDGEEITTTVTADAANAGASHSASDVLTWRIDTKAPLVAFASQGLARADTDYSYTLRMASDCMWYRSTANHAEPSKLCAESYTNVFHMPTGATFVSASHGGVFDSGTGTVTWRDTGVSAATGWGSVNGFGAARNVTVQFPKAMFTDSCSATATASFDTSVTYLDGQVKSDSATTTHDITSCEPFALATKVGKSSTTQVSPNIIWDNGFSNTFTIRVGNKANVPGVAVITDNGLGADHIRAHEVVADGGGKIAYTLDDNTTGTAVGTYTAPAGRRITAITVTSPEIAGPNKEQSSTPLVNEYNVRVKYTTVGIAPDTGWPLTNTASAIMTYPGNNLPDFNSGSNAVDLVITPRPANFTSVMSTSLTTPGSPVPGVPVNFTLHGVTSAMKDGAAPEPQYIFIAPANWALVNNSWSLATGAPSGALFEKKTVTIDGEAREALAVTWPAGTTWGDNATWPALRLQAMPTAAATPGSQAIASGAIGDASHSFPGYTSTWGGASNGQRYTDVADLDGDSVTTEYFAVTTTKPITVGAAAALSSVKEICRVNADAADGCDWLSDSSQAVPISPVATDVKYRVTLRNNGTTSLSNVVAYDVLPHVGDTGISSGSAATPRGSQFAETVQTVPHVSSNLTLTYSESTNPCRSEVYPGGPADCAANWSTEPAGAVSVRAAVAGAGCGGDVYLYGQCLGRRGSGRTCVQLDRNGCHGCARE
ncbi:hypothetical protein [Microbacterium sp. NC79]|uniref:hypothetical protein n=1 Tax=Microbacterium sp. NC79 TaxID=2851009 RepID=UPI001C2C8BA3|nr:hypothetical protein [Microbacterium sp. NC79]MBV0893939.1 hypothetical protein [Microbacterium sp. NC79]